MTHLTRADENQAVELGCALARGWGLDEDFAIRLSRAILTLHPMEVTVISGQRSQSLQESLEGAAPFDVSTHANVDRNGCPRLSTGADLRISVFPNNNAKATFGAAMVRQGLRWGGGSPIDPQTGIPSDWNHIDAGRRDI